MNKFLANLHQGAIPSTHKFANELRHRSTEAEQILWSLLRNRKVKGKKFRRQHAIANTSLTLIVMSVDSSSNWRDIIIKSLGQRNMIKHERLY